MKTLLNKTLVFIFLLIVTSACDKDDDIIIDNPSLSANEIEGTVTLPVGSTLDLSSLTISSPVDAVNIENGNYRIKILEDQFLTQLVSNNNDDVYLMGYSYPEQIDFEINSKSTALAMLMNLAPSLMIAPEGKQELINKILSDAGLSNLTDKIDALLINNISPLDITNTELAEAVATFYNIVFSAFASKSQSNLKEESFPIEIRLVNNEITFVNPGKSYETVVGIYKEEQLVKTLNIERVSFVPTGIGDVIGAVVSANQGEIPSGLQPVEKTYTMEADGQYDIKVRNGFYTNGLDSENVQAYLNNLINWNTDIILEILPLGNCVQPLLADLREFIQTTVTLQELPGQGEVLGLLYNILSEFLAQSLSLTECFLNPEENTQYLKKLKNVLSFTGLVGKLGHAGNILVGVAQWYYDDGAMEECYKVENTEVTECNGKDVYVAGTEYNGNFNVAIVWKNGVATSLTDGSSNSSATSVYVSDKDVYVAGTEYNGSFNVARVWKNGVATSLSSSNSSATSVYVSDKDVYVAGTEYNGNFHVARVWKNGVATSLTDGSSIASSAQSVYVSDNDVYASGYIYYDGASGDVPVIWKNGVATSLSNSTGNTYNSHLLGTEIYVAGTDVYVTGVEVKLNSYVAIVWKNGVATSLSEVGSYNAYASSVYVSGNDVYVVGSEIKTEGGYVIAKIWKNSVATSLGSSISSATSVYVSGNDVYAAGHEDGVAIVWKNGVATSLGSNNSNALSIFVK